LDEVAAVGDSYDMLIIMSALSLVGGTLLACGADKLHVDRAMLERCGGLMIILGLALIGGGLPLFR